MAVELELLLAAAAQELFEVCRWEVALLTTGGDLVVVGAWLNYLCLKLETPVRYLQPFINI